MIAKLFSPLAAKVMMSLVGALLIALGMAKCTIDRQQGQIVAAKQKLADVREVLDQANANHRTTKENFRASMETAWREHNANLGRIAEANATINERTIDAYQIRRRATADAYDRLRREARASLASDASSPALAAAAEATCRAVAAASCDEIPALLKAAQDNTDKLLGLQFFHSEHQLWWDEFTRAQTAAAAAVEPTALPAP